MQYIQWFPGHMTKTRRQIEADLTLVDAVCEIVDARIPMSSRNPDIDAICGTKCISATMAVLYPSPRSAGIISAKASPSFLPWAVRRTIGAPASAMRSICVTDAATSAVAVLVIDCTAMGLSPPIFVEPIATCRLFRRENFVKFISKALFRQQK